MTEKKTAEEFESEQRAISDDQLAKMAQDALSKLCKTGGRSLTMTVPPRIDDTDMVIAEVIRRFKAYAAQQSVKMPTKDQIVQYFNNHSDCYADVIIGDYETTEPAMTVTGVLKFVEWLRNQIEK